MPGFYGSTSFLKFRDTTCGHYIIGIKRPKDADTELTELIHKKNKYIVTGLHVEILEKHLFPKLNLPPLPSKGPLDPPSVIPKMATLVYEKEINGAERIYTQQTTISTPNGPGKPVYVPVPPFVSEYLMPILKKQLITKENRMHFMLEIQYPGWQPLPGKELDEARMIITNLPFIYF